MTAATQTATEVKVPDIGDFDDVPVIEVHVKPGDAVNADDPLITLESDKATMDVPSPAAGAVADVLVKVGDTVSEGTADSHAPTRRWRNDRAAVAGGTAGADASGRPTGGTACRSPAPAAAASRRLPRAQHRRRQERPTCPECTPAPACGGRPGSSASTSAPSPVRVRKVGLPRTISLGFLRGPTQAPAPAAAAPATGAGIPEIPAQDFSKFGPVETKPLARIKKISGPFLHRSWLNVPHVTHNDEADITDLDKYRKELDTAAKADGYRVTLLAFLVKACVSVLKQFPDFNSSLSPEKDSLILKKFYNIGIAVDTPDGLVVPVVKDADRKGIIELSKEFGDISKKARDGKLSPNDLQGGTFTISSLGGIGGTSFTPIVNAPEVAILGVVRSKMSPVWNGSEFVPRMMLPVSLSYDHRVIDGAAAARFTRQLCHLLEDDRRLIL